MFSSNSVAVVVTGAPWVPTSTAEVDGTSTLEMGAGVAVGSATGGGVGVGGGATLSDTTIISVCSERKEIKYPGAGVQHSKTMSSWLSLLSLAIFCWFVENDARDKNHGAQVKVKPNFQHKKVHHHMRS